MKIKGNNICKSCVSYMGPSPFFWNLFSRTLAEGSGAVTSCCRIISNSAGHRRGLCFFSLISPLLSFHLSKYKAHKATDFASTCFLLPLKHLSDIKNKARFVSETLQITKYGSCDNFKGRIPPNFWFRILI